MIKNKDRADWIGCSDTDKVMGNWNTATFRRWFHEKVGLVSNNFSNKYTRAGTQYEHKILEAVRELRGYTPLTFRMDEQIIIPEYSIRANYDGTTDDEVFEVKTFNGEKEFKVSKTYWRQAQAEMVAWKLKYGFVPSLTIVAYPLTEENYRNYFCDIDRSKLMFYPVVFDESFEEEYLKKVKYIAECMKVGRMPVKGAA